MMTLLAVSSTLSLTIVSKTKKNILQQHISFCLIRLTPVNWNAWLCNALNARLTWVGQQPMQVRLANTKVLGPLPCSRGSDSFWSSLFFWNTC